MDNKLIANVITIVLVIIACFFGYFILDELGDIGKQTSSIERTVNDINYNCWL